ncbi:MAG TPA: benzoate-CoA ligase family protein [Roseiarcus sp.]|nr:benzoate-CoA ligase family protein [Roseiarcus sp.]
MFETTGNAAAYFVDRHAEGPRRDHPVFREAGGAGRTLTYGELGERSGRVAAMLARHGVERENRVALLMTDTIDLPTAFWGAIKAGVAPTPLNTLLSSELYREILDDSRARALIVSKELLPVVAPLLSQSPHLSAVFVAGGDAPQGMLDFAAELEASAPRPTAPASPDECAFWLYSSGSTGQPKGVRHAHASLKYTADTYGAQVLGIQPDDLVFSAAKLFFAYGLGNAMTFPMSVGATSVLYAGRPTPDAVFEVFAKFRPNVFCVVPTLYAALDAKLEAGAAKIEHTLRRCISAGEALPAEVGAKWARLAGCEILDGVGSTEMLHIFLSNRPGEVTYGASGAAVPGYELRLVDESGAEVAEGAIGELLVKGDSAAMDYFGRRAQSRATFEGHWTRTGDKYEKLAGGRYRYCGRTDDMFKVSGVWVSPFEVEQALIAHASVLEAAVVSMRDADGLEKPKAYVVLKPGASTEGLVPALQAHVKAQVGMWKYPRVVEFCEDLPKTATGKIQRFKLRG